MAALNPLKILVPTDFTPAADKAVELACVIASNTGGTIDLLHIISDQHQENHARVKLESIAGNCRGDNFQVHAVIKTGHVLDTISHTEKEGDYDLIVIGTHGAQGLRQNLFGADILRLIKHSACPALVVQKDSAIKNQIKKILLPVGSHDNYHDLVKSILLIAQIFDAEIFLFRIDRGEEMPASMSANLQYARKSFADAGVACHDIVIDMSVYSFGYAKQTLLYAHENNMDMIGIMPHSSAEHSYFANADKERVLTNEHSIPVLCAHGM